MLYTGCAPDEFLCPQGSRFNINPCISDMYLCDGTVDCFGGTDEENCEGMKNFEL